MSTHEIKIEYEGRNSDLVMGMYVDSSMVDDIDMLGWNLCDCDDARFQEKVGNCRIVSEQVGRGRATVIVSLDGIDEELKEKTIDDFFDGLDDFIWRVMLGLRSRIGECEVRKFSIAGDFI
jgi:hypothetical protein